MQAALRSFRPPFCPNPRCDFHGTPVGWRYRRAGSFRRHQAPRCVPRYQCSRCKRSFSSQTFSPTYWLKRPALLARTWDGLLSCAGYRQLARTYVCSPTTVMTHAARLGRHALLFLAAHRPGTAPAEPVVVDGFESFEFSQFHPLHLNLAVGARSHFVYAFTDAELRRKGRMTPAQRRQRRRLEARFGRPDPRAIERSMAALLRLLAPPGSQLELRSDEHVAYPRAWRQVPEIAVRHRVTPSRRARTAGNPLFPVNRVDLWLRHSGANHKRETIAYSKRRASVVERCAMLCVYLNFQKSFSEKRRDATPAQRLGILPTQVRTREVLAARLFPSRVKLPAPWRRYYRRDVATRCIPNGNRHRLAYAY
jgi:transposase-like protein